MTKNNVKFYDFVKEDQEKSLNDKLDYMIALLEQLIGHKGEA